jgi:hypothetical protein
MKRTGLGGLAKFLKMAVRTARLLHNVLLTIVGNTVDRYSGLFMRPPSDKGVQAPPQFTVDLGFSAAAVHRHTASF